MSRTRKIEAEYAEAIKFQDVLKELNFESVGEFVELVGGVMGMINVNDIDNAKKISEAFSMRIGYILEKIEYVDKVIEKNKSMRDFYEDHQRKLAEAEALKKAKEAEVTNEPAPAMTLQLDSALMKDIAKNVDQQETIREVAVDLGSGWFQLADGTKIRGKKNLPDNVVVQ